MISCSSSPSVLPLASIGVGRSWRLICPVALTWRLIWVSAPGACRPVTVIEMKSPGPMR